MRLVLILLLVLCLTPAQALAAGNGMLTLNDGFNGFVFRIYHVADADGNLTSAFSDYPVIIPDSGNAGVWQNAANTLAAYTSGDNISPDAVGTVTNGCISFSDLEEGIYLVTGDAGRVGDYTYTPIPFLVRITDSADSVTANVKYDRSGGEDAPAFSSYTVKKVWSGDTAAERPESVTVRLLHNGNAFDTVTLQESNGWCHTWNRLDADGSYQVIEADVPAGYTVSVSRSGTTFTVTNTANPPDNPDNPDEPPEPDTEPSVPETEPPADDEPGLPQTGLLWWPVPLLIGLGMVLCVVGLVVARNQKTDEKN